jgi:hypothetical protein
MHIRLPLLVLGLLALPACQLNVTDGKGGNGNGNGGGGSADPDDDGDGVPASEDCDDLDGTAYPGAEERCDGRDNDCDGEIDEAGAIDPDTFYADADGDGYGDPETTTEACDQPEETVDNKLDCDDTDAELNPDTAWFRDRDSDGHGDPETEQRGCTGPESSIRVAGDCDDRDASVYPDAPERCNTVDDDCDGDIDEDAEDASIWYPDADTDGFGDPAGALASCQEPSGYVDDDRDCDDADPAVFPGADEVCNDIDDDCDGIIDESGAIDAPTWYTDADADGYGDPAGGTRACDAPSGSVADDTDCDDSDADTNPGATEYCDGHDDDCDGTIDEDDAADAVSWTADADGDGYGDSASGSTIACEAPSGYVSDDTDCDDADDHVNPGAAELCDGVDTDCDSATGESGLAAFESSGNWQDVTSTFSTTYGSPSSVGVVSDGTLMFCAGTWYGTLYLDADVDVTAGSGTVLLDGADAGPVVVIDTGGVTASLSDLTLTGGVGGTSASGIAAGGGFHCEANADVTMNDLTITDNSATEGGGLKSEGCDLILEDVEITDNTATYGGGLALYDGTHELIDCLVEDNTATSWGGGIEVYTSGGDTSVDLDGTQVTGNDGGGVGGGVFLYESPYTASVTCDGTRSTVGGVYDNVADDGGGVFIYSGTFTATTCDTGTGVWDNEPDDAAGAAYSEDYGNNASFVCTRTGCTP